MGQRGPSFKYYFKESVIIYLQDLIGGFFINYILNINSSCLFFLFKNENFSLIPFLLFFTLLKVRPKVSFVTLPFLFSSTLSRLFLKLNIIYLNKRLYVLILFLYKVP